MPPWFYELLESAKTQAGSRSALARKLGMAPTGIIGWEEGGAPGADKLIALLDFMGGDIRRALPGWIPSERHDDEEPVLEQPRTEELEELLHLMQQMRTELADAERRTQKLVARPSARKSRKAG